jgi:hypothetical protein
MQTIKTAGALLALVPVLGLAAPNELPQELRHPDVAYDGTRIMSVAGQDIESRFHYAPPGKHRQEMNQQGMSVTTIIREDLNLAWSLLPQDMYLEIDLSDEGDGQAKLATPNPDDVIDFEKLGSETVNGHATTRYRVIMKHDGEEAEGYFWLTEERIPMRMELTSKSAPDQTMTMVLRDLQVRAQDDALFELPPGAQKMAGLSGLGQMMRNQMAGSETEASGDDGFGEELAESAAETAQRTAKEEANQGVKDAVKKGIKGLFGR